MGATYVASNGHVQPGAFVNESRSSVLVLDDVGTIFASLRELGMSASLWRIVEPPRLQAFSGVDLAILATYDRLDWRVADSLAARAPTLVIARDFSREDATTCFSHGLIGYLHAELSPAALGRALAGALRGEPAYGREVTGAWLRARRAAATRAEQSVDLTPRQRQIVELISRGATDKEIAGTLGIATATAQKHVTNILERLHVPNRAAAVAVVSGRPLL